MSYLKEFRETLAGKLQDLDEEGRQEVIDYVASAVLESYRNGQKSRVGKSREGSGEPAVKRPAPGSERRV